MTKFPSSPDWKFRDLRFERDMLVKISDVLVAAVAYGEIFGQLQAEWDFNAVRCLPDFYNLDKWQVDALREIACETELAIRVEKPELQGDMIMGAQRNFGPFCECLTHLMRHLGVSGVVCVPCASSNSEGGYLGMVSSSGWDYAHMREIESDPFGAVNRLVGHVAIAEDGPRQ